MASVGLGVPVPVPVVPRRVSRRVMVGAVAVGGGAPVIADIHFQPRYVFAALAAGCAAVRVNPGNIKISVKHHDPLVMIAAYRQLAQRCDYPLHLGVTEAGSLFQGTIKSAVAFGVLLAEGIGDTLRVSLSAPPVEEVKVGHQILESLGLRPRSLEIVSCPSCGRAQADVYTLADQVKVIKTVPEHLIVQTLLDEALQRDWSQPPE